MHQEAAEAQEVSFMDSHPWLELKPEQEDDSVEEVIRYTLDEIRFA